MGSFNGRCYLTKENYSWENKCHMFSLKKESAERFHCTGYAFGKYNDYGCIDESDYKVHFGSPLCKDSDFFLLQLSKSGFDYAKSVSYEEIKHLPLQVTITYDEKIPNKFRNILETTIRIAGAHFTEDSLACYGFQPDYCRESLSTLKEIGAVYESIKVKNEAPITTCTLSGAPIYEGETFKQLVYAHYLGDEGIKYIINLIECKVNDGKIIELSCANTSQLRGSGELKNYVHYSTANIKDEFFNFFTDKYVRKVLQAEFIKYPAVKEFEYLRDYGEYFVDLISDNKQFKLYFKHNGGNQCLSGLYELLTASPERRKEILLDMVKIAKYKNRLYIYEYRDLLSLTSDEYYYLPRPNSFFAKKKEIMERSIIELEKHVQKYEEEEEEEDDDDL